MIEENRDISVVICAHTAERWDALRDAVDSVRRQSLPAAQLVVVIDHNAELFDRARGVFGREAMESRRGPGLAGARNEGVEAATSDIVAFLDDDAVASADWLERLSAAYADERVLAAGGRIEPDWAVERPRWYPHEFDWVVGCSYRGMPESAAPVRNVIGANMSFRRDVLLEIGGFREGLGRTGTQLLGDEETDACIRATQRHPDGIILYEPAAHVLHHVPEARCRWSYFSSRCFAEGVSKARLAGLVGSRDGLSSERRHVLETLPRGVAGRFGDTLTGRDAWGVVKAGAMVAGLAVTAAGYAYARLDRSPQRPA